MIHNNWVPNQHIQIISEGSSVPNYENIKNSYLHE